MAAAIATSLLAPLETYAASALPLASAPQLSASAAATARRPAP
jgi:hypothetical protein